MSIATRSPVISWSALLASALTAVLLIMSPAGCGGNGALSEVESLVTRAQEAGEAIESYHMVLTMSFEGAEAGRVKTEELVIDICGEDISLTDIYYDPESGEGTVIQEVVRAGDRQWGKDFSGSGWMEQQATLDEETAAVYTAHISDYLSNSIAAQKLGVEDIAGAQAVHLRFELSPENLSSLLSDIPRSSLETSTGGQVDIWIDEAAYYPLKYRMVFRNVSLGSGYEGVDVHIDIDITSINQPIEINPPV